MIKLSESATSKHSEKLEKPNSLKPEKQKEKIKEAYIKLAEALKP